MYLVAFCLRLFFIGISIFESVGPDDLWAKPIHSWGVRRPMPRRAMARAQHTRPKTVLGIQPRTVQSSADPKAHQRKGQSRYKTKLGREPKNIQRKAALIAVQCSAPDKAVSLNCYNHSQPLYVWADGTNICPWKSNLHVGAGEWLHVSIKGKISH